MTSKTFFLYTLIGVIYMFNLFGCSSNLRYEKYSSKDPEISITMDYISGWFYSEHRGSYNSYAQVLFYEKGDKAKDFKAGISVNVRNVSKIEFSPATIEAMSDDIFSKRMKFKDSSLVSKSNIKIAGEKAIVLEFLYKTLDKLYDVNAKLIPVREKIVIFKRGDKFYTLRYENTSEEFNKYNKAFSHIIDSIKFKY